jgi:hypothetical protein
LPLSIKSGVEVFENLTELITNDIDANDISFFTFVSDDSSDDSTFASDSSSDGVSVCHFKNLVRWSLDRCTFTEFSFPLAQLRVLSCECESLFLEFPSLTELSISCCSETTEVEISGKNGCDKSSVTSVGVSQCGGLTSMVITRRITALKILKCPELFSLTVDRQSPIIHLKTKDCPKLHISAFAPIVSLAGDEESEREDFVRRYQDR